LAHHDRTTAHKKFSPIERSKWDLVSVFKLSKLFGKPVNDFFELEDE
jgi:hypothetical protein